MKSLVADRQQCAYYLHVYYTYNDYGPYGARERGLILSLKRVCKHGTAETRKNKTNIISRARNLNSFVFYRSAVNEISVWCSSPLTVFNQMIFGSFFSPRLEKLLKFSKTDLYTII